MDPISTLRPSRAAVIELLTELVAIDSTNPSLVPGARGESELAGFVAGWLGRCGLEVEAREAAPGRLNVIARLRGTGHGRVLVLNAHLDTVGVADMEKPFDARVDGDRLFGRGAYDMKGGLAAIMLAAQALAQSERRHGDVIVTAVADEEYASLGTQALMDSLIADAAIVTEPTGLRLCVAHKGFAWFAIETRGEAAHGSKPEYGVDAIAHMGRVLQRLELLGAELRERPSHPLVGTGSIHASLIEGGQELSTYPARCRLQIERRTVPGETRERVKGEIAELLAELGAADPRFNATSETLLWRDPFEVGTSETIVTTLAESIESVTGTEASQYGDSPWMDAALLAAAGIPTVVFGPGGAGAHAAEEYVSLREVAVCAEALALTAFQFSLSSQSSGKTVRDRHTNRDPGDPERKEKGVPH